MPYARRTTTRRAAVPLLVLGAACVPGCQGHLGDPPASVEVQLAGAGPVSTGTPSTAAMRARDRLGRDLGLTLRVRGGELRLQETGEGAVLLKTFRVDIDDIAIPAGVVHSQALQLSDLSITLTAPLELPVVPADNGDALHARGAGDLALHWSITTPAGETYPFAPQPLRDAQLEVVVTSATGTQEARAEVLASFDRRIGRYFDRLELDNLQLRATSGAAAEAGTDPVEPPRAAPE